MDIFEAIRNRRTIRFFKQEPVSDEDLRGIVDAARLASCAANMQRLRFVVARTPGLVNDILAQTKWAGRVQPRRTPQAGETGPAAFIAITIPDTAKDVHIYADAGAAIQSMELEAWGRGLGCCWIGSVNIPEVEKLLEIGNGQKLLYVVAIGYPAEEPVSEDISSPEGIAYYLDENNKLHVPKLAVDAVTVWK
ncbi:MAG: nitroreductase family protein [Victivallales bacterium]|nr:nitroreductase family protein [Victivallales bacterium]